MKLAPLSLTRELKIPLRLGSKTRVLTILALPQSHCAHTSGQQTWGCFQAAVLPAGGRAQEP